VHISRDGGKKWKRHETQPRFEEKSGKAVEQIWQIVPGGPKEKGVLYCGVAPAALFRSEDGGKSWGPVKGLNEHETREKWQPGGGGMCLHSILVNPADPRHLLGGISAVGVFETLDGGATWALANLGLNSVFHPEDKGNTIGSCVHRIAFASGGTGRIYMQNHVGVFRRENIGSAWQTIENGLPSRFGFPLVAHPHDSETAYTIPLDGDFNREPRGGRLAVYRTKNGGGKWQRLDKGLPRDAHVGILRDAFCSDGMKPAGLYFGTTSGQLYASNDDGEAWSLAADKLPPINSVRAFVKQ
jgi:photosystem II stability/assembly factor-like uncharacterized protein